MKTRNVLDIIKSGKNAQNSLPYSGLHFESRYTYVEITAYRVLVRMNSIFLREV